MRVFILLISFILTPVTIKAQEVHIAIAANLNRVIKEITQQYHRTHPDVRIRVTQGASGVLSQQIMNGARFDIFMSADRKYPEFLQKEGLTKGDISIYGYGRLAIWSKTLDVSRGIQILKSADVVHIAIARPESSPFGERAIQFLKYYNLYEPVKHKLVYAGNIAQAAQFAQTGNTEVAIIAYSLLFDAEMKGYYFLPDVKSYSAIEQACVLLTPGAENPDALRFMEFLLSEPCKTLYEKYGITTP